MPADERPYRRRVLLNTASTTAANVWAMVVMLVWVPLLLHGLGAQAFGIWVLLQAFSATNGWLSIAELGVGTAITHFVAVRAGRDDHDGALAVARAGTFMLFAIGTVCDRDGRLRPHCLRGRVPRTGRLTRQPARRDPVLQRADHPRPPPEGFDVGARGVPARRPLEAHRRHPPHLVAAATAVVALAGGGLAGVAIASLAATAVAAVAGAARLRRHTSAASGGQWPSELGGIVAYSWRVALVDANGVVHRSMDRVIVGAVIGPAAVTLVEIATQIQNAANAVLSAMSYAVTSSSAWLRGRGDTATLRELLERGTRYSLLLTWPLAVMSAVLADPLIRLWVGPRYHEAAGLAIVALLPLAAAAPLQVGSNMLRGTGHVQRILWPAAASTAVNLVASIVLVHVYGIVGVFIGTLIGTVILVPSLGRAVLDEYGLRLPTFLREAILPALLPNLALLAAALACVAVVDGAVLTVVVTSAVGLAVYGAASVGFGLKRGEIAELVNPLRRRASPP